MKEVDFKLWHPFLAFERGNLSDNSKKVDGNYMKCISAGTLKKKRIEEIDIIKALGIICMVAGHSSAPFTKFIYLFHMAIFFIASGFFFKDEKSNNIGSVFKGIFSKIKQLWLPFFVWSTIYVLLHNVFIQINVYTENPELLDYVSGSHNHTIVPYTIIEMVKKIIKGGLFSCGEQMFGASWFLKVLFMVSVCYLVVNFLAKKLFKKHVLLVQLLASVLLLALGYFCSVHKISAYGFANIVKTASFYCLYFIGHILGLCKDKYLDWNWKQFVPIFLVSFGLLFCMKNIGSIALDQNHYENPLFLLAASLTGWAFLYSMSYFIKLIPGIKEMMLVIGKRTLTVVILHFLSIKIVEVIVVAYYGMPAFCVAAFPNLYGEKGLWWFAYTVVGVGVPIVANILYHLVVDRISFGRKKKVV
ncbi:MAG TPA: hypothetical protein DD413_05260 [Ruminococcus sp.]|nr:hypothetical protein [Ruminococcus sp.]